MVHLYDFKLLASFLLFLMMSMASSMTLKECDDLLSFHRYQTEECIQMISTHAFQSMMKYINNSAVEGSTFYPGFLDERTATTILSNKELMFETVVLKNTNWRTFTIGSKEISKSFALEISGNPLLTDVHFDSDVFANKTIIVRGNGQLSRDSIERLKKIEGNNTDIQEYGECSFSYDIRDFSHLHGCTSITHAVAFSSYLIGKHKMMPIGRDVCLFVWESNLTSIAFLDLSNAYKHKKCRSSIKENPLLCLSERQKTELERVWPNVTIEKNDDNCEYECLASEIMDGTLRNKTCYVIRGQLVLDDLTDGFAPSIDFSKVAEFRGGGLKIIGATIDNFELFPNLLAIDLENSQGAAIEVVDTELTTFSLPNLLKIECDYAEGPLIILKNNLNLNISEYEKSKWEKLSDGRLEISNDQKTSGRTNPTSYTRENVQQTEFPWLLVSIGIGTGIAILLCLVLFPLFVFATFKNTFKLPKIKALSKEKKELLKELAEETLKMNPLEWRQLTIDEAQQSQNSSGNMNIRNALRTKYSLFLDKILINYPLKFPSPAERKDSEIFSILKKFYQKTKGKKVLVLLSNNLDPSVSVSIFSGKRDSEITISGRLKENGVSAVSANDKDSTVRDTTTTKELEQGGKVFEAKAKLLRTKKYNEDIMVYLYSIQLTEGDTKNPKIMKFQLKLVNYHTWESGPVPKDRTTIIQLCQYSRKNKSEFATTSSGHMFCFLMNKMIADHLNCSAYPKITIDEARMFLTDVVQISCSPDALIFCLMVVLEWANKEMLISPDNTQKHKDFSHIYEKLIKYMSNNPNNRFFDVKDLQLNEDVYKRLKEKSAYKKLSTASVKEASIESTISTGGKVENDSFKKDKSEKQF